MKKAADNIAFAMCLALMGSVLLFGLVFSADYLYIDAPAFSVYKPDRILYLLLAAAVLGGSLLLGKLLKWNRWACLALYLIISIAYIAAVPLEPFSDMGSIYNIAVNDLNDPSRYLSNYPTNIPIALYVWLITRVFGKSILVPKIFNILFDVVIIFFVYKIAKILASRCSFINPDAVPWFMAPFLPAIIYQNHIYSDVLFTVISVVLIYLVILDRRSVASDAALIGLSVVLYMIRAVGIIYIIAIAMHMILRQKKVRKCVVYVLLTLVLIFAVGKVNKTIYKVDKDYQFSFWSWVQMGINEEEFGFQDGTHSTDWTLQDCIDKYRDLGPYRVLKIYAKKEIWLWSEGTFQAARYGFGDATASFSYGEDSPLIKSLLKVEESPLRIFLDKFMKAQYYIYVALFFIGLIGMRRESTDTYRLISFLTYIICGFFCFYLIWEIKSRYVYCLYPILMLYGYYGLSYISRLIPRRTLR